MSTISHIIAVFIGSGLGGACRYTVTKILEEQYPATAFPVGTFIVNITGCFLIGLLSGLFSKYGPSGIFTPQLRMLLTVGFCGGFTTFSTFINESFRLTQLTHPAMTLLYIGGSIIAGLALLYLGYRLTLN